MSSLSVHLLRGHHIQRFRMGASEGKRVYNSELQDPQQSLLRHVLLASKSEDNHFLGAHNGSDTYRKGLLRNLVHIILEET